MNERNLPKLFKEITGETIDLGSQLKIKDSLKQGSLVLLGKNIILKDKNPKELAAYELLETHRHNLERGFPKIVFPEMRLVGDTYVVFSRLQGKFPNTVPDYFGNGSSYTRKDFILILQSINKIRREIGLVKLDKTLQAARELSFISNRNNSNNFIDTGVVKYYPLIEEIYTKVENTLRDTQLFFSHGDIVRGNFFITGRTMFLIDWESYCYEYIGYDEGRLYVNYCLASSQQELFQSVFNLKYKRDLNAQLVFWRTAITRAYKELGFLSTGKYSERIDKHFSSPINRRVFKEQLFLSLKRTLDKSISMINKIPF